MESISVMSYQTSKPVGFFFFFFKIMLWGQERSHLVGNFLEGDVSQSGKRSR